MTPRRPPPRVARGFTLLEAIVAMTIFSMCALALFGWQGSSLRALDRIEAHADREQAVRMALAVVQRVNPLLEPKGERELGDQRVRWTSEPVAPVKTGVTQVGLPSIFDVGLFELTVTVERKSDAGWTTQAEARVRAVGYKQVRSTGFEE